FTYFRYDSEEKWYIEFNLCNREIKSSLHDLSPGRRKECRVLGNYGNLRDGVLRAYECNLYWLT
ncbi:MAG: hypothetical protein IKS87_07640, partial [Lachnospiraceae bacterium]|nr:hypothetical protein [Lachnospiraceae bacterium]